MTVYNRIIDPPLFTKAEVEEVRARISLNRRQKPLGYSPRHGKTNKPQKPKPKHFLLRRILTCKCDRKMRVQAMPGTGGYYLGNACRAEDKSGKKKRFSVSVPEIDKAVWEAYVARAGDPEFIKQQVMGLDSLVDKKPEDLEAKRSVLFGRLAELDRKLERAKELYIDGDIAKDQYQDTKNSIMAEKFVVDEELSTVEAALSRPGSIEAAINFAVKDLLLQVKQIQYLQSQGRQVPDRKFPKGQTKDVRDQVYRLKREVLENLVLLGGEIKLIDRNAVEVRVRQEIKPKTPVKTGAGLLR